MCLLFHSLLLLTMVHSVVLWNVACTSYDQYRMTVSSKVKLTTAFSEYYRYKIL